MLEVKGRWKPFFFLQETQPNLPVVIVEGVVVGVVVEVVVVVLSPDIERKSTH